ncbi:MAG: RraA family protein [Bacteroidia bacterium]|nr:RraA family protein [Bacteroidia bacterium]MBP9688323.1 RraA family protein [Bacteroidia bacterium]
MNITEKCIELIESNRISSTEVADALDKTGVLNNLQPVNTGRHVVGRAHYVYAHDESNWPLHDQIQELPENCLLYVDTFNCGDKAIFGDLVSKYLLLYKKVKGIVVQGKMRDIPDIKKYSFPIWCTGYSPLGCYNRDIAPSNEIIEEVEKRKRHINGGIIVCDDSGCTLIKKDLVSEDTFNRLELIELQEDIWSFCINTLKWSTYDTVCQKKYLTNPEVLPDILKDKVKLISFKK